MKSLQLVFLGLLLFLSNGNKLCAQTKENEAEKESASEIARKLADPNASIGFFAFPIDYISYGGSLPGASDQSALKLSFQPSLPYVIEPGKNLFLRPLIPVVLKQSTIDENGQFSDQGVELGDIGFDAAFGVTHPSKWVTIVGLAGSAPTATSSSVGAGTWTLGPDVFLGKATQWGFAGVLLNHLWGFSKDISITGGQYFYTVNLKGAWQIQAQPTYSYNHKAANGSKWTIPLAGGLSNTVVIGNMPLKMNLQYWYFVARAEAFAPQHQFRLQIAPVVTLPW